MNIINTKARKNAISQIPTVKNLNRKFLPPHEYRHLNNISSRYIKSVSDSFSIKLHTSFSGMSCCVIHQILLVGEILQKLTLLWYKAKRSCCFSELVMRGPYIRNFLTHIYIKTESYLYCSNLHACFLISTSAILLKFFNVPILRLMTTQNSGAGYGYIYKTTQTTFFFNLL